MNQNLMDFDIGADKLREECGVFGMYDFDGNDVARTIYYGLFALQHRGQESCGIAVSDTEGPKGKAAVHKGMGLCNEVFTPEVLEGLRGNIGVGHVRYSTAGSSTRENAQPLVLNYVKGILGLAHNGNLVNAPELRHELENLYRGNDGHSSMFITVLSFGFKYGIPADADLVFDVRFLPNPYYVEELRFHTGTEKAVQDYVMQGGTGEEFLKKLNDLLEFVIPKYEQEGKTQLVIAIGCTGGRHRSVTIAGEVFKRLTESGRYEIRLEHRDAGKDGGK